ncbi:MAG: hypothetical protein J6Y37_09325 [Paludibacteraceae bacterium]|nr:hypothetical protein [Paludibacteraceae bacterium]
MAGILDKYRQQLEIEKQEEKDGFTMPSFDDELSKQFSNGVDVEEVRKKVEEMKNDLNNPDNMLKRFNEEYHSMTESDLLDVDCVEFDDSVSFGIIRAKCPSCGKEIVSKAPLMYNPFTLEKVSKYDCECGWKANLEHSYPRIVCVDSSGHEIKFFSD